MYKMLFIILSLLLLLNSLNAASISSEEPEAKSFYCDFDLNDNCGGNITTNFNGFGWTFRTDETHPLPDYTITDVSSIYKPTTARGFEGQVCEIPFFRNGREYYHCVTGVSCQSKNNSAVSMTCTRGRFLTVKTNLNGNSFNGEWKLTDLELTPKVYYEVSYYVLMFCQGNETSCYDSGDYIKVSLGSEAENLLEEEHNFENVGQYRVWVRKSYIIRPETANFELKVALGREKDVPSLGYYGVDEIVIAPYEGADVAVIRRMTGHTNTIWTLELLANGFLATGSRDDTIRIWNPANGRLINLLYGHTRDVYALKLLPDGNLASGSDDGTLRIWDLSDNRQKVQLNFFPAVRALELLTDDLLAIGLGSGVVSVYNLETNQIVRSFTAHEHAVYALRYLDNGLLATGGIDGTINLWTTDNFQLVRELIPHGGYVTALEELSNGNLASGSTDGTINIFDVISGELVKTIESDSSISDLQLLSNGFLASAEDKVINVWNPNSGNLEETLYGHTQQVNSLELLSNGNLASGSFDNSVIVWRV